MSRFPAAFRRPATGVRFSIILFPPRDWAFLTVGLPAQGGRTQTGLPRSARTSYDPGGPSIPRGRRCSPRSGGRPQPAPAAPRRLVLQPRSNIPSCGGLLERGINEGSSNSPVRSSPRLWPPGWNGSPWAFLRASHPAVTGSARRGWGQAIEHGPGTTRSTSHQSILRPVVHSFRATSRRTVQRSSLVGCRGGSGSRDSNRPAWPAPALASAAKQAFSAGTRERVSVAVALVRS